MIVRLSARELERLAKLARGKAAKSAPTILLSGEDENGDRYEIHVDVDRTLAEIRDQKRRGGG